VCHALHLGTGLNRLGISLHPVSEYQTSKPHCQRASVESTRNPRKGAKRSETLRTDRQPSVKQYNRQSSVAILSWIPCLSPDKDAGQVAGGVPLRGVNEGVALSVSRPA
jgi:hypothetical protein